MFSTRIFHQPWVAPCAGVAVLLVLCAAFIAPVATLGFVGDDIYRSTIPAYAYLSHQSLVSALSAVARSTDQTARSPLQMIVLGIWFFKPGEVAARCLQWGLLLANVLTLAGLAARLFGTRLAGILAAVCLFTTLQIRLGNDPILGQTATSTVGCEFLLLALLALHFYLEQPSRRRLLYLLLAFSIALVSDPSAIALVAIVPVILAMQGTWPQQKRALVCLSFVLLGVAISAVCYLIIPVAFVPPTFGAISGQVVAALPLAYRVFHAMVSGGASPGGNPPDQRFLDVPEAGPFGFVLACCGMAAACLAMRLSGARQNGIGIAYGAIFGAGLWLVPALLAGNAKSAISDPLSTVYVQSFGVALLLTAALTVAARRWVQGRGAAPAALLLLFVGLTLLGNEAQANLVSQHEKEGVTVRGMLEEAGKAGLFRSVPGGSTIAMDAQIYPFRFGDDWRNASYMLYMYSGRRYQTKSVASLGDGSTTTATWIMRYDGPDDKRPREMALSRYVRGGFPHALVDEAIAYQVYETKERRDQELARLDAGGRGMIASSSPLGPRSAIVTVRRSCGPVEQTEAMAPSKPAISWGKGFLPDLTYLPALIILDVEMHLDAPIRDWRFMGPAGELTVQRDACPQGPLVVTMTVASAAPAFMRVGSDGRSALYAISQYPSKVSFLVLDDGQQFARLEFQTNAPRAHLFDWAPRTETGDFNPDPRLFVLRPEAQYL